MEFINLVKTRYSCRNYLPQIPSSGTITQILEAGRLAPSAVNYQPWFFDVYTDPVLLDKVRLSYQRDWFQSAPAVIIFSGDSEKSWKRKDGKDHVDIDIAIAVDHISLCATSLGLATCWVCNFDVIKLKESLQWSRNTEPLVLLPFGYPADQADTERHNLKRKTLAEIATLNGNQLK